MPVLQQVVLRLNRFPELAQSITLTQLDAFLRLVSRLLPTIRSNEINTGRSRIVPRQYVGCASSSGDGGSSSFDGATSSDVRASS
jgi:hypothetical protein